MTTGRSWIVVLLLAVAAPVLAQEQSVDELSLSRAALLAAEREKKASDSTPPERAKVEHALFAYDNWSGLPFLMRPWHGFQRPGAGFPAGAGFVFGLGYRHDLGRVRPAADPERPNRMEVDAVGAYSTREYSRALTGFTIHNVGGARVDVRLSGQHYEYPQEDFFGFGQDSLEENRTNYLLRSTEGGADVRWQATRLIEVAGGVAYLNPSVGSGTDSRFPSTDQAFDVSAIPGYADQPDFLRSEASAAFDWRDNPLHPHAGGRYAAQFSNFDDRDLHSFGFRRYSVELQQYIPIPDRYRTIALRAAGVFTDAQSGNQVPFYFQPTLGGARALRGFREFRFRDQNAVLVSAEYRWEAWWALDGALFVDAGTVAPERQKLSLRNFDASYGIGFRLHSNRAFVARLDLAFSREGFIPLLRFEHAF
ncbi:MAG TPA: BamA/TamA family outer membrane protein, partial [Planctomycetaceae bacterium]|nr:BamA/TamA family outer membrane protein [Planctomycetaceae bacterium]